MRRHAIAPATLHSLASKRLAFCLSPIRPLSMGCTGGRGSGLATHACLPNRVKDPHPHMRNQPKPAVPAYSEPPKPSRHSGLDGTRLGPARHCFCRRAAGLLSQRTSPTSRAPQQQSHALACLNDPRAPHRGLQAWDLDVDTAAPSRRRALIRYPRAPHHGPLAWDPEADALHRLLGLPIAACCPGTPTPTRYAVSSDAHLSACWPGTPTPTRFTVTSDAHPHGPLAWDSEVDATDTRRAATKRSGAPSGAARLAWP